jgi:hypothetical protein
MATAKSSRKRIRRRVGDVVCIPLGDEQYGFGRVLQEPLFAFYDFRNTRVPPISKIVESRVIFKIWVMNHAVTSGRWPVVGSAPLEPELAIEPEFCKEDPITGALTIYHQTKERPAALDECDKLEAAAVWEPHHVEGRLRDYFAGVPNATYEWLRPGRLPTGPRTKRH